MRNYKRRTTKVAIMFRINLLTFYFYWILYCFLLPLMYDIYVFLITILVCYWRKNPINTSWARFATEVWVELADLTNFLIFFLCVVFKLLFRRNIICENLELCHSDSHVEATYAGLYPVGLKVYFLCFFDFFQ